MKSKKYLAIAVGTCLAIFGLNMVSAYYKSMRVSLDTYEHELGIPNQRGPVFYVAESPEVAQGQIRPFWHCIAGCLIAFLGFSVTLSSLPIPWRRNAESRSD